MKKPEEIKKGLNICSNSSSCRGCPYKVFVEGSFGCEEQGCADSLLPDALAYILQLEAERDAAVEDMRMLGRMGRDICVLCEHYDHGEGSSACSECVTKGDRFAWRGITGGKHVVEK